jgi:hypothetical protein
MSSSVPYRSIATYDGPIRMPDPDEEKFKSLQYNFQLGQKFTTYPWNSIKDYTREQKFRFIDDHLKNSFRDENPLHKLAFKAGYLTWNNLVPHISEGDVSEITSDYNLLLRFIKNPLGFDINDVPEEAPVSIKEAPIGVATSSSSSSNKEDEDELENETEFKSLKNKGGRKSRKARKTRKSKKHSKKTRKHRK